MRLVLMMFFGLAAALGAQAAPFLIADPFGPDSATVMQPDAASISINGGPPIACTLAAVAAPAGGKRPVCDLASITASGTYPIVLTVSRAPSCANTGPNAGQCTAGGSASSAPFGYTARSGSVAAPTNPVLSAQ